MAVAVERCQRVNLRRLLILVSVVNNVGLLIVCRARQSVLGPAHAQLPSKLHIFLDIGHLKALLHLLEIADEGLEDESLVLNLAAANLEETDD